MTIHRYADGPYLVFQRRQRDKAGCPGNKIAARTIDCVVRFRILAIATDPGLIVAEFKRQTQSEQAIEDTRVLKAQIRAAEEEANRYADAIGNASASGPAVARLMGRSATAEDSKATLGERLVQVELQQLALERQSRAVEDRVEIWVRGVQRLHEATFNEQRTWLTRLGIEVVVAKHGSDAPRYEVSINLPVEIESVLTFDPNRDILVEPEAASWTSPGLRPPEQPTPAQRHQVGLGKTRPYPRSHSSRSGLCAGTAGGSPRPDRSDRRARSR
jgi:hypothetical protein